MKKPSKLLSALTSLLLAVVLLTGSIAVPILWRGFYYGQIDALSLPARTGFSPQVIRGAFDEVMDYLVKDAPFGTGQLQWSESGRAHFADCKALFRLDFRLLLLSAAGLLLLLMLAALSKRRLHRFLGRGVCFWAALGLALAALTLGVWAFIDFESLFIAFHTLFFPGKTNWIFDYRYDEIILILPQDFWMGAAGLTAGLALGGGIVLAVIEALCHKLRKPKSVYEELRRMDK